MKRIRTNPCGLLLGIIIIAASVILMATVKTTPHSKFGADYYTYSYNILVDIYNYIRYVFPGCGVFVGALIINSNLERVVYNPELYEIDQDGVPVKKKKVKEETHE